MKNYQIQTIFSKTKTIAMIATSLSIIGMMTPLSAFAIQAQFSERSDKMTNQTISEESEHDIRMVTPAGINSINKGAVLAIEFPAEFDMNSIAITDLSLKHTPSNGSCNVSSFDYTETLAASASATAWGAAISGQTISLTSPTDGVGVSAIVPNSCIQVYVGTGATLVVNPDTPDTYTLDISATGGTPTSIDIIGNIAVPIITDDEVSVTANIDETITFAISDNSISFAELSATQSRYATGDGLGSNTETEAHTLVVGTNAANGYTLTMDGGTLTNYLGNSEFTINAIGGTNTAPDAGTEQFGIRLDESGGAGEVSDPYADTGFALDTAGFPDALAYSDTSSADTTYSARYVGNIDSATEAGLYEAGLTYLATANF